MNDNDPRIYGRYFNPFQIFTPESMRKNREFAMTNQPMDWNKAVSDFTRVCDQTCLSEKLRKD